MEGKTFLYLTYAALMKLFAEGPNEYCDLDCPGKDHVRCLNGQGVSYDEPFKCTNIAAKYLTEAQVQQILDFHNEKRRFVASGKEFRGDKGPQPPAYKKGAIPDLEWDNELAALAQQFANQCTQWSNYKCSDTKRFKVGQNVIHSTTDSNYASLDSQLNEWYNEVEHFNPENVENYRYNQATRRYAQIVSARTKKIGCGYVLAAWNSYKKKVNGHGSKYPLRRHARLVCNYGPDGLVEGQALYKTSIDINEQSWTDPPVTTELAVYILRRPNHS